MKPALILLFLLSVNLLHAQQGTRPRIGLTLSGGGAKGLAHIGILKALDSAGINVDYITGTSMGSIIGSLYAIGYSGAEIEKIAREMDWRTLLTNQTRLRSLAMEEKEEYGRYAIELPFAKGKFSIPTGALEAQELWIKMSELYFPAYHLKIFDSFPIPFKCIATDIANAEVVVQDKGEIVTAIRASMAIPGVFTTVDNYNRKLVDGGVVRNFPVSDVKAMGADIVIGSNVAHGLLPKEQLTNPAQILLQISFFKNADESKSQVSLCDYYINQQFKKFSTGSFGDANEIIDSGILMGRNIFPMIRHLADSLNAIYGVPAKKTSHQLHTVFITTGSVKGMDQSKSESFLQSINFQPSHTYTVSELSEMVRRGYSTRDFNFIHYTLEPLSEGKAAIAFEVEESTPAYNKLGIHYNTFTGIGLVANFTTRNYFTPHSRSLMTFNIGENFRYRAEHMQYLGKKNNVLLIPNLLFETFKVNTYDDFEKDGLYRQNYFKAETKIQSANKRDYNFGAGFRYEWVQFRPLLKSLFDANGRNQMLNTFAYFNVNTLDRPIYPEKGWRVNGELGFIFDQKQKLVFTSNGVVVNSPDSLNISSDNYAQVSLNAELFTPVNNKITITGLFQTGINFDPRQNVFNSFSIGGLSRMYRNQIVFAGLQNIALFSNSVAAVQAGVRYKLASTLYLIGQTNVLANNFIGNENQLQKPKWLTGHAVTFAYNSIIGPIELSGMYCDQAKSLQAYVSLGISF